MTKTLSKLNSITLATILILGTITLVTPAYAQPAFSLCLLNDRTGSIGQTELDTILDGYEAAFRNTDIQNNIVAFGPVEVSFVSFAVTASLDIAPTVLTTAADAENFADAIAALSLTSAGRTNYKDAIETCVANMDLTADKATIDIATDGKPNEPQPDPKQQAIDARNAAIAAGVDEINALAIGMTGVVVPFLFDEIIFPDQPSTESFVIEIMDVSEFEDAILEKIFIEVEEVLG